MDHDMAIHQTRDCEMPSSDECVLDFGVARFEGVTHDLMLARGKCKRDHA